MFTIEIIQSFLATRRLSALTKKVFEQRLPNETVEECLTRACLLDMLDFARNPAVRRIFFRDHRTVGYADIARVVMAHH